MSAFLGVILLQAGNAPPGQGSPLGMLMPIGAIFLIFYFLLIRPQQKKQKETEDMIKTVAKGDSVVTSGGMHGKVTGATDDVLTLEIAALKGERVRVKVDRNRVERVIADKGGES
jgi:preprotein translocase subunit YajC